MEVDGDVVSVDRGCGRTRPRRWYSLQVDSGEKPSPRVGHTATAVPHRAQVILIGGASPDALYDEAWRLDLNRLQISRVRLEQDCPFPPRYEHCAVLAPALKVTPEDNNHDAEPDDSQDVDRIWVFAGANMEGNLSDLWELEIGKEGEEGSARWRRLWCDGDSPSPRTLHTATALLGDSLTLFGGGLQAASPVEDASVYRLDAPTRTWATRNCSGTPPCPRQGHVLVAAQNKLIVHGGMASNTFFSDLFVLSGDGQWQQVPDTEPNPGKRAGHGSVMYKKWLYIWGGLGPHGSLGDLWRLDTESLVWEEVSADGVSPKPRLDFAMCVVHLPAHFATACSSNDSKPNGEANGIDDDSENLPFVLLHGGMDDQGSIYDDFHVLRLES